MRRNCELRIANGEKEDPQSLIRRPCEVCLRRLAPRSLTILHDDLGEHELCAPCEERWSRQVMTFFAKDLMAWSRSSAWRKAA